MANITEEHITDLMLTGGNAGMKALYDKYVRSLTALCSRYLGDEDDVKDVLQEVFIKVFTQFRSFKFRGEGSLSAWVARIAVNMSINHLKNAGRMVTVRDEKVTANIAEGAEEPDSEGISPDELQRMIMSLPDGYRTVINLYVFEGKSHKEIADILNIKAKTSASQLYHAKAMMAKKINEYKNKH